MLGPTVRGALDIDGRTSAWHARIDGQDVPIERNGSSLHFTLPNGGGEFRGHVAHGAPEGFWVQLAGVANRSRYATPVRFTRAGPKQWRGRVRPQDDRIRVFVSVAPSTVASATFTAFISDPEFNAFRRRTFDVVVSMARRRWC